MPPAPIDAGRRRICSEHGLAYDPRKESGCVLCRRPEARARRIWSTSFLVMLIVAAGALTVGVNVIPWHRLRRRPAPRPTLEQVEAFAPPPVPAMAPQLAGADAGPGVPPLAFHPPPRDAAVTPVPPGTVDVAETTETFMISGATPDELRASLDRTGTFGDDGKRHAGYTSYDLHWQLRLVQLPAGCKVGGADVKLQIRYVLPHWMPLSYASPGLAERWTRYLDGLTTHESGHGEIAKDYAQRVRSALEALPPQPDCEEASRAASDEGNRLFHELKAREADYDMRSGHGAAEGASL